MAQKIASGRNVRSVMATERDRRDGQDRPRCPARALVKRKTQPQQRHAEGCEASADDFEHTENDDLNPGVEFSEGFSGHHGVIR